MNLIIYWHIYQHFIISPIIYTDLLYFLSLVYSHDVVWRCFRSTFLGCLPHRSMTLILVLKSAILAICLFLFSYSHLLYLWLTHSWLKRAFPSSLSDPCPLSFLSYGIQKGSSSVSTASWILLTILGPFFYWEDTLKYLNYPIRKFLSMP